MVDETRMYRREWESRDSETLNAFTASFESESQNDELVPADTAVLLSLAHFAAVKKNFNEARRLFERIREIEAGNVAALTGLASVELLTGRALQGQNLFLQAARIQAFDGRTSDARGLYQRAVESHPSQASSWVEWGSFEEWQGDATKAREYFSRAVLIDPSPMTLGGLRRPEGGAGQSLRAVTQGTRRRRHRAATDGGVGGVGTA